MMRLQRFETLLVLVLLSTAANADQKKSFGDFEVHYIVVTSTFFSADVAEQYGLTRGADRALVNISVLGPDGMPVKAKVSGTYKNLLSQITPLEFREVLEQPAVYYLSSFRFTDQDILRFSFTAEVAGQEPFVVKHQQRMWTEE